MQNAKESHLPKGFVYVRDIITSIKEDIKYYTSDNFLGRPVDGYERNVAILTKEAAETLAKVQSELQSKDLSLKIFDGYRPQRACDDFWNWAEDPDDIKNKQQFYPDFEDKHDLFKGYIARYSRHSRGSTVDLTIVRESDGSELDMGTIFDYLGEPSHTNNESMPHTVQLNRRLLKETMERHGFENYWREWWHYELKDEPFKRKPEDHFDFVVR